MPLLKKLNKTDIAQRDKVLGERTHTISTRGFSFLNQLDNEKDHGACRALFVSLSQNKNPMFLLVNDEGDAFAKHQPFHGSASDELEQATGGVGADGFVAGENYPCVIQNGRFVTLSV
tara:strand:- start:1265 stop:1618 length:354 start_codon:yes stop_codon:yes gene_type:complete